MQSSEPKSEPTTTATKRISADLPLEVHRAWRIHLARHGKSCNEAMINILLDYLRQQGELAQP